jgi:hypothetical protein
LERGEQELNEPHCRAWLAARTILAPGVIDTTVMLSTLCFLAGMAAGRRAARARFSSELMKFCIIGSKATGSKSIRRG